LNRVSEAIIDVAANGPREVGVFPVSEGHAVVIEIEGFLVDGIEIAIAAERLPSCDSNQSTRLVEKEFDRSIGYAMGLSGVKLIDRFE